MKITSPWRRNNNLKKNQGSTPKPKIAWQRLGLTSRKSGDTSLSIDEIRRQVIQASNQALGHGLESNPKVEGARSSNGGKPAGPRQKAAPNGDAGSGRASISAKKAKR